MAPGSLPPMPRAQEISFPRRGNSLRSIWAKIEIRGENECWLWEGTVSRPTKSKKNPLPYGMVQFAGVVRIAHRLIWASINGRIPDGLVIRHTCDNPRCCNPAHLLSGTYADNARDMISRHRADRNGERNNQAKLTNADVIQIRELLAQGVDRRIIAPQFGVTPTSISNIKHGLTWRHLQDSGQIAA